ncbi:type I-E CRISPR-associated protein Cse1/CasA [Kitasatospora brasiliensis]|uniref:type I-E CRISPR-associated protein Cse1/CasA n=1 Tax=Kitasatospora brasiliensis TaxID=3058040 RepID=UPI0029313598|nr:type I-E CRISPR-associated protein Cse1/CasA [Kitasatospora sp. K002]
MRADLTPEQVAELPVRGGPGEPVVLGLGEVLTFAHLLEHVDCPDPASESALLRILIAITARVTGLDEAGDWDDHRWDALEAGRLDRERIAAYFGRYTDRFDLFDAARPWLQEPRLAGECTGSSGTGRLLMTSPSGNNHVWWPLEKGGLGGPIPTVTAAFGLLTWLFAGPSGTAANRRRSDGKNSHYTVAGPIRALVSWFPAGRSLAETLVLGVPSPDTWPTNPGRDEAPWEAGQLSDPRRPAAPAGPVSLLTARAAHAVLLEPDADGGHVTDSWVTWAWENELPEADDPYVIRRDEGGPVRANCARVAWRDLDALLLKTVPGKTPRYRPAVLASIASLPRETAAGLRLRAYGLHQERRDPETAWFTAVTPPVLGFLEELDENGAAAVSGARARAEGTASGLAKALRSAWQGFTGDTKVCPWVDSALPVYWSEAEAEFWKAVVPDGAGDRPQPGFQKVATRVFDAVTEAAALTPRGMQAVEEARAAMLTPPRGPRKKQVPPVRAYPTPSPVTCGDSHSMPTSTSPGKPMSIESSPSMENDPLKHQRAFMLHVHQQCSTPGGRAAVRSVLVDPGKPFRAYEYLLKRIPRWTNRDTERAYTLTADQAPNPRLDRKPKPPAGLTAPVEGDRWCNLGWSLARAVRVNVLNADTVKARLLLMSRQDADALTRDLPPLVARLRSGDVPVVWPLLLRDLTRWVDYPTDTARAWVRAYYQYDPTAKTAKETS